MEADGIVTLINDLAKWWHENIHTPLSPAPFPTRHHPIHYPALSSLQLSRYRGFPRGARDPRGL